MNQQPPGRPGRNVGPTHPFEEFRKEAIEQSIPERFEQQVARYPERLAAKGACYEFTYQQLNATANQIAHAILAQRGPGEEPVGVLLETDALAPAAYLGILKAGKSYVPLDPAFPRERLADWLEDSTAELIVTDGARSSLVESLAGPDRSWLLVDDMDASLPSTDPKLPIPADTVASIYYTSGTSGRPKGVYTSHRNLLQHIQRVTNAQHVQPRDRFSSVRSISFGGAMKDVFGAVLNGASVWFFDLQSRGFGQMASWLAENQITIYVSVATTFRHLAASIGPGISFPALRYLHIGGEPLSWSDLELFKQHFPPACVFNLGFGITETGNVAYHPIHQETKLAEGDIPAGYPLQGMEVLILDEAGQEVEPGQVGQIAVRSHYLALGYWRQPELTRARFRPDPDGSSARVYLSGDLGYLRPDGCLVHMGRADDQVKVAGHRIEPVEVERALLAHPQVKEAVVTAHPFGSGELRLVAYFVPATQPAPTASELRRFLATRLSSAMIPARFIPLDEVPLTRLGKVDRRALPAPDSSQRDLETAFVGPRNPVEEKLAAICEEVLDLEQVGVYDNFFDLGGDSLRATQVMSRLRDTFQVEVPLLRIFETPTIAELAPAIEEAKRSQVAQITPIPRRTDRR